MTVFVDATGVLCYDTRDLMRGVSCPHCLNLAIGVARGANNMAVELEAFKSPMDERILQAGNDYEELCLKQLEAALPAGQFINLETNRDMKITIETLRSKQPIAVAQARLERNLAGTQLNGFADLLIREDFFLAFDERNRLVALPAATGESQPGGIAKYRVYDVKLASKGSVNNAMQIALYVDALQQHQMASELAGGLVLGNHTVYELATTELVPATILARNEFVHSLANAEYSPSGQQFCDDPADCNLCLYSKLCNQQRHEADDLHLVANLRRRDVLDLRSRSISTMTSLANASDDSLGESQTYLRAREQAKLQIKRGQIDDPKRLLTKAEALQLSLRFDSPRLRTLPNPSPNDLFFDFEGYPAFEPMGLEYLFGILENPVDNPKSFHPLWAHDYDQERQALIDAMQLFESKLSDPTAHIYHYGDYEISALRRLTHRHGILAEELNSLLQNQRFINLQRVVEQCVLIGAENYSIKSLEPFYGHSRSETEVQTAVGSIDAYWLYLRQLATADENGAAKNLAAIEEYNLSDCVSTEGLYSWLSSFEGAHSDYPEFLIQLQESLRTAEEAGEKRALLTDEQAATRSNISSRIEILVKSGLVASESYRIHQTLLHAIDFYPAEASAKFVEKIIRLNAPAQALEDDPKVLVILAKNLHDEGVTEPEGRGSAFRTYYYEFEPGQSFSTSPEASLQARMPSDIGINTSSGVTVLDCLDSGIRFKQILRESEIGKPFDLLFEFKYIATKSKEAQVFSQVDQILLEWKNPLDPAPRGLAILDLLARREPALFAGVPLTAVPGSTTTERVANAISAMQTTTVCIQGPPGTGKTYLASRVIQQLIAAGKTVGVTSNSHAAVENLLAGCHEAGIPVNLLIKKPQGPTDKRSPDEAGFTLVAERDIATRRLKIDAGHVVGGTSFDFVKSQYLAKPFDYLFIDEAAQFSLVDAIAVAASTKNLVLLGDPQQLTQVVQATHFAEVDESALGFFMAKNETIPANQGFFLERTWRMHPELNTIVSQLSYDGQLLSEETSTTARSISTYSPGLRMIKKEHEGFSSHNPAEALEVVEQVKLLLDQNFIDANPTKPENRKMTQQDILVVSPFNAQVNLIKDTLKSAGFSEIEVGTVDKFQGRQAPAVIVSLAASDAQSAPRGLGFVLDRNRLNVAISRAKVVCLMIYGSHLIGSKHRKIEDLQATSRLLALEKLAHA